MSAWASKGFLVISVEIELYDWLIENLTVNNLKTFEHFDQFSPMLTSSIITTLFLCIVAYMDPISHCIHRNKKISDLTNHFAKFNEKFVIDSSFGSQA